MNTQVPTRKYDWFQCTVEWQNKVYSVPELVSYAEKLPVHAYSISNIYLGYQSVCDNNLLSFVEHVKRVWACDTTKPIIMAPDGYVLDGRHRLIKLLLEKAPTVYVRRFPLVSDMPPPAGT